MVCFETRPVLRAEASSSGSGTRVGSRCLVNWIVPSQSLGGNLHFAYADTSTVISGLYRHRRNPGFASITGALQPLSKPGPVFTLARYQKQYLKN